MWCWKPEPFTGGAKAKNKAAQSLDQYMKTSCNIHAHLLLLLRNAPLDAKDSVSVFFLCACFLKVHLLLGKSEEVLVVCDLVLLLEWSCVWLECGASSLDLLRLSVRSQSHFATPWTWYSDTLQQNPETKVTWYHKTFFAICSFRYHRMMSFYLWYHSVISYYFIPSDRPTSRRNWAMRNL